MKKLIDKAAVVTEIERRKKGLKDCHADTVAGYAGEISGLERLLSFLDTLDVKDVDLEQISKHYALNNSPWDDCWPEVQDAFKAGFELGLKAQKGE